MISLLGFPLLMFWLISEAPSVSVAEPIRLFMPKDDCSTSPYVRFYDRCSIKKDLIGKKVTTISFHKLSHSLYDQSIKLRKLDLIRREMERITFTNDTNSVIKIIFGDEITFENIYSLLNGIQEIGIRRYAWFSEELFIFGNEPPQPPQPEEEIKLMDL